MLAGPGVAQFESAVSAVDAIYNMFCMKFGKKVLLEYKPISVGASYGMTCLTRYFTYGKFLRNGDGIVDLNLMDKAHVIEQYIQDEWRHLVFSRDNYVRYQQSFVIDDSGDRYVLFYFEDLFFVLIVIVMSRIKIVDQISLGMVRWLKLV